MMALLIRAPLRHTISLYHISLLPLLAFMEEFLNKTLTTKIYLLPQPDMAHHFLMTDLISFLYPRVLIPLHLGTAEFGTTQVTKRIDGG